MKALSKFTTRVEAKVAFCAMAAVFCFSLNDALIKFLSGSYALHQIVLVRSFVGILILFIIFIPLSGTFAILKTQRLGMHLLRGLAVVFANLTFFLGLAELPLAVATSIFFISPLLITIFSIVFLKEYVGVYRWGSIIVGLLGILIILRPGTEAFKLASLLPIAAAFGYATLHIVTRYIGKTESALTMSFYIQVTFILICSLFWLLLGDGRFGFAQSPALDFLLRKWGSLPENDWPLFLLLGACSAFGGFLISQAYRNSEAAFVAPFEYIAMPLSIFWGLLIFNTIPDLQSLTGMLMIIGSGLFIVFREMIYERKFSKKLLDTPHFRR